MNNCFIPRLIYCRPLSYSRIQTDWWNMRSEEITRITSDHEDLFGSTRWQIFLFLHPGHLSLVNDVCNILFLEIGWWRLQYSIFRQFVDVVCNVLFLKFGWWRSQYSILDKLLMSFAIFYFYKVVDDVCKYSVFRQFVDDVCNILGLCNGLMTFAIFYF